VKSDKKNQVGNWENVDKFYINILTFDKKLFDKFQNNGKGVYNVKGKLSSEVYQNNRNFTLFIEDLKFIRSYEKKSTPAGSPISITPAGDSNDDNPFKI